MNRMSLLAGIAILCSVACKKVAVKKPEAGHPVSTTTGAIATAENLGNILTGNNVFWKINPISDKALVTYSANSNTGYNALMIDNGHLNGALPINAFRFISADLLKGKSNIIEIKSKSTGLPVGKSVGRIIRYIFGTNRKFYVATEASPDGGGHLIEYDPFTQTAWDLGQPCKLNGKFLSIYSLNVGADGALYGGSFGGNGDVITFRYDYNGNFETDKTSIDAEAKYVGYVSGDARYTYASVGQDKWKLYAIDRASGDKKVLLESNDAYGRIEIASHVDGAYGKLGATHYKLNGFTATSLGAYNTPSTKRNYYTPYETDNTTLPTIVWDGNERKLYYKFPNAAEASMQIGGIIEDVYPLGTMVPFNNTLFINSAKTPLLASYSRNQGFKYIGSGLSIHCMAPASSTGENKMYCGGYPRGFLMEYKINNTWTLEKQTTTFTPPDVSSTQSNPRKLVQLQDPDVQGVYGSMYLSGLMITKDGYLVGGGNNDRLTVSTNREISFSAYKNGENHNFYLPEFQNYEFYSMCLTEDSLNVYIAASHKSGGKGKIYTYNPATNSVKSSIEVPVGTTPGTIVLYKKNIIVGAVNNYMYMLDVLSNKILWEKTLTPGQAIYNITMGPDKMIWIANMYVDALTTRISKLSLTANENGTYADVLTTVAEMKDADADEKTKPTYLVFMPSLQQGRYDLYISGLKSLYRVNNCAATASL